MAMVALVSEKVQTQKLADRKQVEEATIDLYTRCDVEKLQYIDLTYDNKLAIFTYLKAYKGNNSFLNSLQAQLPFRPNLSQSQLMWAARNMVKNFAVWMRQTNRIVQYAEDGTVHIVTVVPLVPFETAKDVVVQPPLVVAVTEAFKVPQAGIYSVTTEGHRSTIRILPVQSDDLTDDRAMCLSYLFGPNNEKDYRGYAYLKKDGSVQYWNRKIREDEDLTSAPLSLATSALLNPKDGDVVLESAYCNRCGRRLTVDVSIHEGYGPECIKKI